MPEQEIREVRAGGRAGEARMAARILLRQDVDVVPADVAAEREVVAAAARRSFRPTSRVRLVARERGRRVGQPARPLEKIRLGGPQFTGSWLLPAMPASPDTFVRSAKYGVSRSVETRELIAQAHREELREATRPVDRGVDRRTFARILEAEQARRIGRRSLIREGAEQLIARVDRLRDARLHAVLSRRGQDRRLVVVAAVARRRSAAGSSRAAPRPAG